MTNKEKLIAIIGEENFRKLERNFDKNFSRSDALGYLIKKQGKFSIFHCFVWGKSPEGYFFWSNLHAKVLANWKSVKSVKSKSEEQELLFKMFVMEWMEYPQGDNERWYETNLNSGLGLKVYEALRSE